jgi:maltose alpha-D-glucosyltransferase/alpha-amylase
MSKDESPWYLNAVFYELNVRAFYDANSDGHGDLAGLTTKLDYLQDLGVDAIWLLPIYPSPLLDDGYDIADYYGIHPEYGDLEDFKTFIKEAHRRDMKVITDLVLNHTSDQHRWFQEARQGPENPFHDYYVWSDDNQKYPAARIIFLDTEDSNWSWDEQAGRYYWHRF